jgi:hypothetical protein
MPLMTLTDRMGRSRRTTSEERLTRQLWRLLTPGRFGPMILWLRGGGRVDVLRPEDLRVDRDRDTIAVTMAGSVREILPEDLMAIGLRPRCSRSRGPDE